MSCAVASRPEGVSQVFELLTDALGGDRLEHEAARARAPRVKGILAVCRQIYDVGTGIDLKQRAAQIQPACVSQLDIQKGKRDAVRLGVGKSFRGIGKAGDRRLRHDLLQDRQAAG